MSILAFVFTGLVWMANGVPQPPITLAETSMAACQKDIMDFEADMNAQNAGGSPVMRMSFYDNCRMVTNLSEARDS